MNSTHECKSNQRKRPLNQTRTRLSSLPLPPKRSSNVREDLGEDLQIQGLLLVLLPSYNPPSISCVSKDHEIVHVLSIGWTVSVSTAEGFAD